MFSDTSSDTKRMKLKLEIPVIFHTNSATSTKSPTIPSKPAMELVTQAPQVTGPVSQGCPHLFPQWGTQATHAYAH